MTTLKTLALMARYLLAAALLTALILYLVSLIADRLDSASRRDEYNIRVRTVNYGEVDR